YPNVRFVLAHTGGRGNGHAEAVRLANDYENVYMDCGGDIYAYRMFEKLESSVPPTKLLFGSDWPMMDQRANLTHILLSKISETFKRHILRDNALRVYKIDTPDS
ncbi:MAG: amidohydrolase family protein, partial [Spirochaetota bacterium]